MDNPLLHEIDLDQVLFTPQPQWLPLFEVPDSPAIHLTPLDWTQYELARNISVILSTNVVNPRVMLQQLVTLTKPDDWRGVVRSGQPLPFDKELLLKLLCSNVTLGMAFSNRLQELAIKGKQSEDAARKNSGAGAGTPSTAPMPATQSGPPPASNA